MHAKPLSQAIADAADAAEEIAIAMGYADASRFVRPLMGDVPDGHIAVGAMDGFTALVPARCHAGETGCPAKPARNAHNGV